MEENTALEQVGSGADRLDSFFTRRGFVKVSGAFVAGMVALGLLPDSAAAAPTSSKGEVDYYATPAHVLKVNRARCTGCQRCEMMCTLQNDGASQPAAARIHVHDGFQFGSDWESYDGVYYSCEWQIRACHMCTTALCQTACPHGAIVTTDDGTRTVDPEKCVGCGTCVAACPWHMPVVNTETHKASKCIACGRCADQCPNGALELIKWENVNHSSGPTRSETKWDYADDIQDFVGGGKVARKSK
ncbi:MAG: 4Fe-4S binding protein [Coriobacteriaceae bacterium]|nr:4Fe-4S binding protein [Coriobacteriaceae bacterium]